MCNSTEQCSINHSNNPKRENDFAPEMEPLFDGTNSYDQRKQRHPDDVAETLEQTQLLVDLSDPKSDSEISLFCGFSVDNGKEQSPAEHVEVPPWVFQPVCGRDFAAQGTELAASYSYGSAKEPKIKSAMCLTDDSRIDNFTGYCMKSQQQDVIHPLNFDKFNLQEESRSKEVVTCSPVENYETAVSTTMPNICSCRKDDMVNSTSTGGGIQAAKEQIKLEGTQIGQGMWMSVGIKEEDKLDLDLFAKEPGNKQDPRNPEAIAWDSSIKMDNHDTNVQFTPLTGYDLNPNSINITGLTEFFSKAKGAEHCAHIQEEQDYAPFRVKISPRRKCFMESPRSLRMLLFREEVSAFTIKDEKHKRDGKGMEFSSRAIPKSESNGVNSRCEDLGFAKRHDNADNIETSSIFSGPITFSGALAYQGLVSYSGHIAYSGNISHRSDSSTSTRSFAFPMYKTLGFSTY
ncbi:hypothetical protein KP509_12G069700 [Ceratopteris richardii]|uniref:Uncharacterized protein n=2 Tax=Ceratopteris richardii TaxID=49495 RepID=A0A8T2TMJ0_CERRI|nr:hypothetical protein KP509_12G069700 [Ceratopteris richardii]